MAWGLFLGLVRSLVFSRARGWDAGQLGVSDCGQSACLGRFHQRATEVGSAGQALGSSWLVSVEREEFKDAWEQSANKVGKKVSIPLLCTLVRV